MNEEVITQMEAYEKKDNNQELVDSSNSEPNLIEEFVGSSSIKNEAVRWKSEASQQEKDYPSLTEPIIDKKENKEARTDDSAFIVNSKGDTIVEYDVIIGGIDVTIPSVINGITITRIGANAFNNKNIRSVIISETIEYIGGQAFANNYLTEVTIPNSVTELDVGAFKFNVINNIKFGDGLKKIGNLAFSSHKIEELSLPFGVEIIGSSAFTNFSYADSVLEHVILLLISGSFFVYILIKKTKSEDYSK